jgi:hypothetical protein
MFFVFNEAKGILGVDAYMTFLLSNSFYHVILSVNNCVGNFLKFVLESILLLAYNNN